MNYTKLFLSLVLLQCGLCLQAGNSPLTLWYNAPGDTSHRKDSPNHPTERFGVKPFYSALPLGNGNLGALVYGSVSNELI